MQNLGCKFFRAALKGKVMHIQSLLATNPWLVNAVDENGETALMASAYEGHEAVVALLVRARADPDVVDNRFGNTALIWAACKGHVDVVRVLVGEAHCNPNSRSHTGHTALMEAEVGGHFAVIEALLTHSCLPVRIAQKNQDGLRLGELFLEAGGKPPSKPNEATQISILRALEAVTSQTQVEKTVFLMGLHYRAGQASFLREWAQNSMFERSLIQQIFSFSMASLPPDLTSSAFASFVPEKILQFAGATLFDTESAVCSEESECENADEGDESEATPSADEEEQCESGFRYKTPFRFDVSQEEEEELPSPKRCRV